MHYILPIIANLLPSLKGIMGGNYGRNYGDAILNYLADEASLQALKRHWDRICGRINPVPKAPEKEKGVLLLSHNSVWCPHDSHHDSSPGFQDSSDSRFQPISSEHPLVLTLDLDTEIQSLH